MPTAVVATSATNDMAVLANKIAAPDQSILANLVDGYGRGFLTDFFADQGATVEINDTLIESDMNAIRFTVSADETTYTGGLILMLEQGDLFQVMM